MSIFTGQTSEHDPQSVEWYGNSLYLNSSNVGSRMTPIGPEYVAPYASPPLRRYTGQVFMQGPHRMHLSECQKSGIPSLRVRPLSTNTMCSSPPFLGPVKWEEYCVSGAPSALRARRRRKTPMSSTFGIIFSIPMLAMWSGGTEAPMSALPSFVQTMKVPVSAIAKLPPVMPAPAARNLGRALLRMVSVRKCGLSLFGSVPIVRANSCATSCRVLWMAGKTIWLGGVALWGCV